MRLDFHLPNKRPESIRLRMRYPRLLHRQLVCWCLIQRYWYYVLDEPKVSDRAYDKVEKMVYDLEREYGCRNRWSPTKIVGSDNPNAYPHSIRNFFR